MADRFDLVIFDNDGVLVDSETYANEILTGLLRECDFAMTPDECTAAFLGRTLASVRKWVEPRLGRPLPADFEDRYHHRLFEAFRTQLTAMPGVAEAIDRIPIPRYVASSGTHERIRLALTVTGLLPRFEGRIFSALDVARGKPEPDLFLHAATSLGIRPERLRAATGGIFTSMDELPALLRRT